MAIEDPRYWTEYKSKDWKSEIANIVDRAAEYTDVPIKNLRILLTRIGYVGHPTKKEVAERTTGMSKGELLGELLENDFPAFAEYDEPTESQSA